MSSERVQSHSLLLNNGDPQLIDLEQPLDLMGTSEMNPADRLFRIDFNVVNPSYGPVSWEHSKISLSRRIHPVESGPNSTVLAQRFGIKDCLVIEESNPPASVFGGRGLPHQLNEWENPDLKDLVWMKDGRFVDKNTKGSVPVILENLNRLFIRPENWERNGVTWSEVCACQTDPIVRLHTEILQKLKELRVGVDFHEDDECGRFDNGVGGVDLKLDGRDGISVYNEYLGPEDNENKWIRNLWSRTAKVLTNNRFSLANGPVAPGDDVVNLLAHNGYIEEPEILENGEWRVDPTRGGLAVWSGQKVVESKLVGAGLSKIERMFTVEVPMWLSQERKDLLVEIFMTEFFLKYASEKGFLET